MESVNCNINYQKISNIRFYILRSSSRYGMNAISNLYLFNTQIHVFWRVNTHLKSCTPHLNSPHISLYLSSSHFISPHLTSSHLLISPPHLTSSSHLLISPPHLTSSSHLISPHLTPPRLTQIHTNTHSHTHTHTTLSESCTLFLFVEVAINCD